MAELVDAADLNPADSQETSSIRFPETGLVDHGCGAGALTIM